MKLNKKGLSPIITTVLIVAVALIISLVVFNWGKKSTTSNFDSTNQIIETKADASNFVTADEITEDGIIKFSYYPPEELEQETIEIVGYKVIADGEEIEDNFLNSVILEKGTNNISLEGFVFDADNVNIYLITSDNKYIDFKNIKNNTYKHKIFGFGTTSGGKGDQNQNPPVDDEDPEDEGEDQGGTVPLDHVTLPPGDDSGRISIGDGGGKKIP